MQSKTAPHTASSASVPTGMRATLLGVDPATLSDRERIEVVAELERLKSAAAAAQARLTAAFAIGQGVSVPARPQDSTTTDPSPLDPAHLRPVGSQVALARRESPSHGDEHVRLAILLTQWLPAR